MQNKAQYFNKLKLKDYIWKFIDNYLLSIIKILIKLFCLSIILSKNMK